MGLEGCYCVHSLSPYLPPQNWPLLNPPTAVEIQQKYTDSGSRTRKEEGSVLDQMRLTCSYFFLPTLKMNNLLISGPFFLVLVLRHLWVILSSPLEILVFNSASSLSLSFSLSHSSLRLMSQDLRQSNRLDAASDLDIHVVVVAPQWKSIRPWQAESVLECITDDCGDIDLHWRTD